MNSEQHPVDFNSIKKGFVISEARIERIYNVKFTADPTKFRLSMLQLQREIERNRPDLLCRCDGNDLRVMTDQEAEEHTWERTRSAVRQMGRNASRRAVIDRSGFTEAQVKVSESRDRAATMLALANRKELAKAERDARLLMAPKPKAAE